MAIEAFRNAAARVPAYQRILREAGVSVARIEEPDDFNRLPILEKQSTFQRFDVEQLCVDGVLGRPGTLLTSSGHSGIFAFGITDADMLEAGVQWIDDSLDFLFAVRSQPTLLVNCLPMGVKVPTRACTLAETSVRADMTIGLIKSFGRHFAQVIIIGEAAFLKNVLELGRRNGLEWREHVVHLILGEEPLAENARSYLAGLLGHDRERPEKGIVFSSMGVAELGLNLFFEVPPIAPLILLRRLLHEDAELRKAFFGSSELVPVLFTYDPERIFVQFDDAGKLIITTLDLRLRVPLIRYAPGDRGSFIKLPPNVRPTLEANGVSWSLLESIPIVAIDGRGEYASAGDARVYPEAVKEGLYHSYALAERTTANFRLISNPTEVEIRVQLSPGVERSPSLNAEYRAAISNYVRAPIKVVCFAYDQFPGGMALDYERKFRYVQN